MGRKGFGIVIFAAILLTVLAGFILQIHGTIDLWTLDAKVNGKDFAYLAGIAGVVVGTLIVIIRLTFFRSK
jgi:hypothetical protein